MEHIKGKLKIVANYRGHNILIKPVNNAGSVAAITNDIHGELKLREANASHLVKCWNAFEKDGLVADLLAVCKKIRKVADIALNSNEIKRGKILNEIGNIAEQEIAKVKGRCENENHH